MTKITKIDVTDKPNGVLFKNDIGFPIICLIKNGKFDWEDVLLLNMDEMTDKFEDISSNPFEFVFIKFDETSFTSANKKSTVPNYTFSKLYEEELLDVTIRKDYENQYGPL